MASSGEPSVVAVGAAESDNRAAFHQAAHELAAAREALIPWNGDEVWQKTLNELAKSRFPSAREGAASEMIWERYLSELWKEVMGELWGPPPSSVCRRGVTDG